MKVTVQTRGREIKALVAALVKEEAIRTANLTLRDARRNCPVESVESINRRKSSKKAQHYGARRGALRASGRVVKWEKNGVYGAFVKFGGITVNGVDTYYARFVELGSPGEVFDTRKGYWGHLVGGYSKGRGRDSRGHWRMNLVASKGERTRVEHKAFLRPAIKRQRAKYLQRMKARLS